MYKLLLKKNFTGYSRCAYKGRNYYKIQVAAFDSASAFLHTLFDSCKLFRLRRRQVITQNVATFPLKTSLVKKKSHFMLFIDNLNTNGSD